jgi:hypothetical protein
MSAADKSIARISRSIEAAMSEEYESLPGRVDSVSRLSYILGLQRASVIIEEEITKEGIGAEDVLPKQRGRNNTKKVSGGNRGIS